nr:MAG TPA: hypothetical protein [Microviridae sp.]
MEEFFDAVDLQDTLLLQVPSLPYTLRAVKSAASKCFRSR